MDVILPLPLHSCFTYALPPEFADDVQIGARVVVPFGRKKYYTAIVSAVHHEKPQGYEVKTVTSLPCLISARPMKASLPRVGMTVEFLR